LFIQSGREAGAADADIASAVEILRGCPGIELRSIELPDGTLPSLFRGSIEAVRQRVLLDRAEGERIGGVIGAGVGRGWLEGVARALRCRAIRLLTADDRARGDRAGVDPYRDGLLALPDASPIDRAEARLRLGVRRGDRVVLVPGRVTRDSFHFRALHGMGMLSLNDSRYRMLVPARGGSGALLARAERRGSPGLVIAGDADDQTLARAADVVLHDAADASERVPLLQALRDACEGSNPVPWVRVEVINRAGGLGRSWWPVGGAISAAPKMIAQAILDVEQSSDVNVSDATDRKEIFARLSLAEAMRNWIDVLERSMKIKESAG
jgi:hypothetical protein